jgi:hypothetical protein
VPDDERGAESRQATPLHKCTAVERIAKWGSGRGSEEKKLKKKKWGEKGGAVLDGDSGSDRGTRCGWLLVRSGWCGAPVTGSGSRAALVGWVSRTVARRPGWLGESDRGALVGWVHFLYI